MQKKSSDKILKLKANAKVRRHSPTKALTNEKFISQAIWECLKNNDPEGVIEVLAAYFEARNKLKLSQEFEIPRATLYHFFSSKNPTIKTLAKVVHAVV